MSIATKNGLIKILKGSLIAGLATVIAYVAPLLLDLTYIVHFGDKTLDLTAVVVGGLSILINLVKVLLKL